MVPTMPKKSLSRESFDAVVHPLMGLTVSLPWKGYGSAIYLELGAVTSPNSRTIHPTGEAAIELNWDWRVEGDGAVLYGSSNSRPDIEDGISRLNGAAITRIDLVGDVAELVVKFSNGQLLRSMVMVSGDPEWSIRLPDGQYLQWRSGSLVLGDGIRSCDAAETAAFEDAQEAAARWGNPAVEPRLGRCAECRWFVPLDGDGHLLDYGACAAATGPLDGRVVARTSGCPAFLDGHQQS